MGRIEGVSRASRLMIKEDGRFVATIVRVVRRVVVEFLTRAATVVCRGKKPNAGRDERKKECERAKKYA